MAKRTKVEVKGLKPLLKRLKKLPSRVQRKVLRSATTKAMTPTVKKARQLAPVGAGIDPDGQERPPLKKTITKTRAKLNKKTGTVYVVAGPEKDKAKHSHLVHDGTAPHEITIRAPLVLQGTLLREGTVIQHPGARPQPFLADAVEATRSKSEAILQKAIREGFEKEARKLAAKGGRK